MSMTEDDLESIATACILFGETRRAAVGDSSDGKLATAFMTASLATTLPTDAVRLIDEVGRLVAEVERLRAEVAALKGAGPYPELHLEPPAFHWTEHGYEIREALREFEEGLEGGPP